MNDENIRANRRLFWLGYLVTLVLVVYRAPPFNVPLWNVGNDDVMRLVQVRDLLGGQGWFDLMQYRLGAEGTLMHWSRLVDLPIAAMIYALSFLMAPERAEAMAMTLWPLLLIGPTLWAMLHATVRFGSHRAAPFGLIFAAIAIVLSEKFAPGTIDHHNVQMMLMAFTLMGVMDGRDRMVSGVMAGVACGFGLSIGPEIMPFVAAIGFSLAVVWLWKGRGVQRRTAGFAGAFASVLIVVLALTQPSFTNTVFRCDTFGFDLMIIGAVGGGGLLLLALMFSDHPRIVRAALVLALGVGVIVLAKLYAPSCLANPLDQIHAEVTTEWLSRITEAKSLLASILSDGPQRFGLLVVPVLAIIYALTFLQTVEKRPQVLILVLAISAAYALTFYQLRGLFFLLLLCVVPISALLGRLYGRYKQTGSGRGGVLVIGVLLISLPDTWSLAYVRLAAKPAVEVTVTGTHVNGPYAACFQPENFEKLAALPVGLIASSTDMGAVLLRQTPHRVLSANFHRNQDGIRTGINLAHADIDTAGEILRDSGIEYVVFCRNDQLPLRLSKNTPEGLWRGLYADNAPDYLEHLSLTDDVFQIYKVK